METSSTRIMGVIEPSCVCCHAQRECYSQGFVPDNVNPNLGFENIAEANAASRIEQVTDEIKAACHQ